MIVRVNGDERELSASTTIDEVVGALAPTRRGVAVAVNGEVVPRVEWPARRLGDGDQVEVLSAIGGG